MADKCLEQPLATAVDGGAPIDLTLVDNHDGTATARHSSSGVTLTVAVEITMSGDTPYLKLTHTINPNGHTIKLGACSDTMVGSNDSVPIKTKSWGYYLDGEIKLSLYLRNSQGVDDVSGWWYGTYSSGRYVNDVFSSRYMTEGNMQTSGDSAAAFHWTNISGNQPVTKTIRMSLSDHVD